MVLLSSLIESHKICSDGILSLWMISHEIEGRFKETSDIIRVSSITDADDVSVSLAVVGVGRGISRVVGWLVITLVLQHTYAGATSVVVVGVPFDVEAMRGISEGVFLMLEERVCPHCHMPGNYCLFDCLLGGGVCGYTGLAHAGGE